MLTLQDKEYLHQTFATKKELTQLTLDIGTEFERVHERFSQMDDKFDRLEDLISQVLLEVRSNTKKISVTIERVDALELAVN